MSLKKKFWSLKASLVVVPSIALIVILVVIPYLIMKHHTLPSFIAIFCGVMFFIMILRSKDIFGFKQSKTFDKVTTILTWTISFPVFIFLGITSVTIISLPIKNIIYKVMWMVSMIVNFIFGVRLKVIGQISEDQVIVIANHCSWLDDLLDALFMGWQKWKVVYAPEVRRVFLAKFFLSFIGVPINRKDKDSRKMVFREIFNVVNQGFNLLIYPEGGRLPENKDEDQYLLDFEDGAFALSKTTKRPIQPVVISWTYLFKPRSGQWWYSPRTICIYHLDPMSILPEESVEDFKRRVRNTMLKKLKESLNVNES